MTWSITMADMRREGFEEGLEQGREQGREQGSYETKLETARKLLARGDSPAEIADLLSLSVSQVQELVENR